MVGLLSLIFVLMGISIVLCRKRDHYNDPQKIMDDLVRLAGGNSMIVRSVVAKLRSDLGRVPRLEEVVLRIRSENRIRGAKN